MDTIQIRKLTEDGLDAVIEVIHAAKKPRFHQKDLSESTIKEILDKQNKEYLLHKMSLGTFFVAEDTEKKKIVGVIGLRSEEPGGIKNRLTSFYITPEYQKRGIGSKLFQTVKDLAIQEGFETMIVNSSTFAEPIYAHFGFTSLRIEEKKHDDGGISYQVWMELALK